MKRLLGAMVVAVLGLAAVGTAAPGDPTDLKVTKTASADSVTVGETIAYTIEVENLGPETATGVTVDDRLPKGVDYVSASSTQGTCAPQGQKVICAIGTLEAGPTAKVGSATVTLNVVATDSGDVTNTASVSSAQKDPVAANDSASVTTNVVGKAPVATCRGVRATVVGTAGSEELTGTRGNDVIVARGGNDVIFSFAGRDLICAGGGSDRVIAGTAANRGFDLCRGGGGLDSTRGCER